MCTMCLSNNLYTSLISPYGALLCGGTQGSSKSEFPPFHDHNNATGLVGKGESTREIKKRKNRNFCDSDK